MWNPIQSCLIECKLFLSHETQVDQLECHTRGSQCEPRGSHQFGIFSHIDRITMQTALTFTSVNPRVACAAQAKRTVRVNAEPINQFVFVYPSLSLSLTHSLTHSFALRASLVRQVDQEGRAQGRRYGRYHCSGQASGYVCRRRGATDHAHSLTHSLTHHHRRPVAYCRCWRSGTFPLCDGAHVKHNSSCGDNVGPLLVKK